MKKIAILSLLSVITVIVVSCYKEPLDETTPQKAARSNREARSIGPYKYEFSTANQSDPAEYNDLGLQRQYYLKASAGYVRTITLTVTKISSTTDDAAFNVGSRQSGCLRASSPSASMGSVSSTGYYRSGVLYTGHYWSVPLGSSAVNTTATCTFTINGTTSSCVEGSVYADMAAPYAVPATDIYFDLDNMSFVRNASL